MAKKLVVLVSIVMLVCMTVVPVAMAATENKCPTTTELTDEEMLTSGTRNFELTWANRVPTIGKLMVLDIDFKPGTETVAYSGRQDWMIDLHMQDGTGKEIISNLFALNNQGVTLGYQATEPECVIGKISYHAFAGGVSSNEWYTARAEINLPKHEYRVLLLNSEGTVLCQTPFMPLVNGNNAIIKPDNALTDDYADWATARAYYYQIRYNTGNPMTYRNVKLYYKTYALTGSATNGSIQCDGAALSTQTVEYNSSKTLTFVPNEEGAVLTSVTVNGVDMLDDVVDNTLTLTNFEADTQVAAVFQQPSDIATENVVYTLDALKEEVTLASGTNQLGELSSADRSKTIGKFMVYDLDFKPGTESVNYSGRMDWNIYFVWQDGTNTTKQSRLFGLNNSGLTLGSDAIEPATVIGAFSSHYLGGTLTAGQWYTARAEVNLPQHQYRVLLLNSEGTVLGKTVFMPLVNGPNATIGSDNVLTDSDLDWATAKMYYFYIYSNKLNPMTYRNCRIYYKTYTLTGSATNGSIQCDGATLSNETVEYNTSKTLTFVPEEGYALTSVTVNGDDRMGDVVNNQLTLTNFERYTTVEAVFDEQPVVKTAQLTFDIGSNGSVKVNDQECTSETALTLTAGDEISIGVTPDEGYEIDTVKLGDTPLTVSAAGTVTVTMPETDTLLTATFKAKTSQPVISGDSSYNYFKMEDEKPTAYVYGKLNDFYAPSLNAQYGMKLWVKGEEDKVIPLPAMANETTPAIAAPGQAFAIKVYGDAITTDKEYVFQPYVGDENVGEQQTVSFTEG